LKKLNTKYEHTTMTEVLHLIYMDDLKLIAKNRGRTPKRDASG
jgi:hypothetical protein